MKPIYLASGGVVCHTGRGLAALSRGLLEPVVRPCRRVIEEITPPVTVQYLPAVLSSGGNRVMDLVEAAVGDALADFPADERRNMALFIASSTADLVGCEPAYAAAAVRGEPALSWASPGAGLLAARVAEKFGMAGRQYTVNTACSSGVHALMYAAATIRRGDCTRALVVGLECPGRVTLAGFNSLLLCGQGPCRPFDRDRDGLIIGEAAAAMVVDQDPSGPDFSGMRLLSAETACVAGSVAQTDADAVRALVSHGLCSAGIDAVDAIKMHGTGTPGNDRAEAAGVATRCVPVTSVKPVLGHTLGACGILETLAMATCWREGYFPPTVGFRTVDPELQLTPVIRPEPLPAGRMLLNYFGFGGNNGVVVLEYAP